jgi:hypothetical protein
MNRSDIERDLEAAERHVLKGAEQVLRQRRVVEHLAVDGHDTLLARQMLQTFEELQGAHIAGRDLVLKELAQACARDAFRRKTE